MSMFNNTYKNCKILVTGHTGFKGSWLSLWLQLLGADVKGISLPPESSPNHWDLLGLDVDSYEIDIRNDELLRKKVIEISPDFVFHLAAQPLVRRSYHYPLETWATNVMGTANLLEACRHVSNLAAIVVVTTDKCYENKEWIWGYREIDPLGGHDPYSASKAGSELVAASYRSSFFNQEAKPLLATARAGNVIGGGDWSEDRLIPDLIRSIGAGTPLEIRSPQATRPWQHVLDCLSGYLLLGQRLLEGDPACAEAWNFGPAREGNRRVEQILEALQPNLPDLQWYCSDQPQPHETQCLYLDNDKARARLAWQPVWTFEEGLAATAEWYRTWLKPGDVISLTQLRSYVELAGKRGLPWAGGLT